MDPSVLDPLWIALIEDQLGTPVQPVGLLHGGEEATVHKLDTEAGAVVLHISPAWRSRDALAWVHGLICHVNAQVPEAVAPLGASGETVLELDGRCAALYPFVQGVRLDREDPRQRTQAAQTLATIHRAAQTGYPTQRPYSPKEPYIAEWPAGLRDSELDAWWMGGVLRTLTLALTHGDYYRGNLLCREGQLVGVIDWHDAQVGPLAGELATATFELCKDEFHVLQLDRARDFVRTYLKSGAPIHSEEVEHLIPLMRMWVRLDAARSLELASDAADHAYALRQIDAFFALRDVRLDLS